MSPPSDSLPLSACAPSDSSLPLSACAWSSTVSGSLVASLLHSKISPRHDAWRSIAPGADLYYEVRMMDAGSGRCDQLLRVERVKSSSCVRGLY